MPNVFRSFIVVALMASTADADAHAFLVRASPGVGSVVATAPKTVRIQFTEPLILTGSDIKVLNAAGMTLSTNAHFEGANHSVLIVDVMPLSPGAYDVEWFVVSEDMHQTEGTFAFTVR